MSDGVGPATCTLSHFEESMCLDALDHAWYGIVLELVILFYCFGMLSFAADHLCNSMETLCDHWDVPEDVGGATFMALGGAVPEITVNSVATVKSLLKQSRTDHPEDVTEAELGVGAILGSGLIAFLAIPAMCTLVMVDGRPLALKRRPLARDICFYMIALGLLMWALRMGVDLAIACLELLTYVVYVLVLCYGRKVNAWYKQFKLSHGANPRQVFAKESTSVFRERYDSQLSQPLVQRDANRERKKKLPSPKSLVVALMAPLKWIIDETCPDCRIYQPREDLYPLTFLASFLWITVASFMLGTVVDRWVTLLGQPGSMGYFGLILVAMGAEIPDTVNAITVASRGYGSMAASACMGSQIINICVGLGLPWTVASLAGGSIPVDERGSFLFDTSIVIMVAVFGLLLLTDGVAVIKGYPKAYLTRTEAVVLFSAYLIFVVVLGVLTFTHVFSSSRQSFPMRFTLVLSLAATSFAKTDWLTRIARATGVVSDPIAEESHKAGGEAETHWHAHTETVTASFVATDVDGVRKVTGAGSRTVVDGGSDAEIQRLREDWAIWNAPDNDTQSRKLSGEVPPPPPPVIEESIPQPPEVLDLSCGPRWQESKRLLASLLMQPEASLQILADPDLMDLEQVATETLPVDLLATTADCGLARLTTQLMGVIGAIGAVGSEAVSEALISNEKLHSPLMTVLVDIPWQKVHASGWPFFPLMAQWQLRNLQAGMLAAGKDDIEDPIVNQFYTVSSEALTGGDLSQLAVACQGLLSSDVAGNDTFVRLHPIPFTMALAGVAATTDDRDYRSSLLNAAQDIIAFDISSAPIGAAALSESLHSMWPVWPVVSLALSALAMDGGHDTSVV
ncbi:hypothetical protein FOL47_007077 [Perkinsus chesapeaki]|uniref:Sodium/calcium exchanger membrane region domain-containing protein n=1 Tax=Perkinsus chesapeaki TaxID=330153 RepID=A0A7J6LN62_PERCH|nr:hypothetical protein FOL47_007077 [Perkinsus chesapeaki]